VGQGFESSLRTINYRACSGHIENRLFRADGLHSQCRKTVHAFFFDRLKMALGSEWGPPRSRGSSHSVIPVGLVSEKVCEYQQARLRERARCRPRRRPAHCPRIYALPMNELLLVDVLRSIATSAVPSFCIMASIGASSERVGHHD
jgi:hypothetical protein